jgi:hypothetical protein
MLWDPESESTLHVLTSDGQYHTYRWTWVIDCSSDEQALVAVIDGRESPVQHVLLISSLVLQVTS